MLCGCWFAIDSAASHIVSGRFYPALRALRGLLPREALLIAAAQAGAGAAGAAVNGAD